MVFSSLLFLFRFLPCVMLVYYIAPDCMKNAWKNLVLFLFSLLFYAWGEPVYVILMIFSTLIDYINGGLAGYFINKDRKNIAKLFVILSVIINLSLLGFFKYGEFAVDILNKFTGINIVWHKLSLPIGISFYTFQTMSYTIDIYRGEAKPEKNIINFGAYVALFPQLIAGPIVRFKDIGSQLRERKISLESLSYGAVRFTTGLGKKVLLANQAGLIFNAVTGYTTQLTTSAAWLGILAYTFQIYFDFSGYSDMAIGLMNMFGFNIPENFNYPYEAKSITEFWRRWHISLGTWFREYVYIPLGGNRCGDIRTFLNIFLVWFLTGLWHGASLNFIAWGLYYCFFLVLEKLIFKNILKKIPSILCHIYTMAIVYIGWILFAWQEIPNHRLYLKSMCGKAPAGIVNNETLYLYASSLILIVTFIIGSTHLPKKLFYNISAKHKALEVCLKSFGIAIILLLSVAYLINGTYNPFLYFRF